MFERKGWPESFDDIPRFSREQIQEIGEKNRAAAAREAAEKARLNRIEYCRRLSDLGDRFADRTFANYDVERGDPGALQAALETAEEPLAHSVGLTGEWQRGKTHLAAAIVNAVNERGIPAIFASWVDLVDRLRETYNPNGDLKRGKRDIIVEHADVPVLVIDDIDKEPLTVDIAGHLYRLLNRRFENNRLIIVTANHTFADFANRWTLGVGVSDRNKRPDRETVVAITKRLYKMCPTWVHIGGAR